MSGLSQRIYAELAGRIRSGAWTPGDRLPTEQELAASYGCARMTVSQALAALSREGLVERRRRAGTFVARPKVQTTVLAIPDIAALIAARGEVYAFVESSREVTRTGFDPVAASTADQGEVLAVSGVHMASGSPFALEYRDIDLTVAPEAEGADFSAQGPGGWLLAHAPWSDARHRISAVAAKANAARSLKIARGDPCLQVERWTWRLDHKVTYASQLFTGAQHSLMADFQPAR